jgi:uncharacterized membrane protein
MVHSLIASLKKPEYFFLILALLVGSVLCFLIPTESGFDELTHMARIVQISGRYFIPNQYHYFPKVFEELNYRKVFFFEPVDPDFFQEYGQEKVDWLDLTIHETRSVYFPSLYLPQAFVFGLLARVFHAPALIIFTLCRYLYLLGYVLLTFFAIRLIPFGKWLLTALALAPMAIYQAATLSPDAYTNGACFLFTAWVLKLSFQTELITWKQTWITIALLALLFSVKVNAVFLLPLLAFLVWKGFETKKMLPVLMAAMLLLFSVEVIGWNIIGYSNYSDNHPTFSAMGQLGFIASDPLKFCAILFQNLFSQGALYLKEWAAIYGYNAGKVPPLTYLLFGLGLLAAWLSSPVDRRLGSRSRILLILTGMLGILLTISVMYVTYNLVGSDTIEGVQGRYFIPLVPVLLLGMAPGKRLIADRLQRGVKIFAGVMTGLALATTTAGIYLTYYVLCGTSGYTPGLCYLPIYRNWESDSELTPPITKEITLQQRFESICTPLRSIRVWSASLSAETAGETLLTLRDGEDDTLLFSRTIENQAVGDYAWAEVFFPPINDAGGRQYVLEITSTLAGPAEGISLGLSERREYRWGLKINNAAVDYDLLFQYGCDPITILDVIKK